MHAFLLPLSEETLTLYFEGAVETALHACKRVVPPSYWDDWAQDMKLKLVEGGIELRAAEEAGGNVHHLRSFVSLFVQRSTINWLRTYRRREAPELATDPCDLDELPLGHEDPEVVDAKDFWREFIERFPDAAARAVTEERLVAVYPLTPGRINSINKLFEQYGLTMRIPCVGALEQVKRANKARPRKGKFTPNNTQDDPKEAA